MTDAPHVTVLPRARPALANLIAVASGKGGVGKTWLAITLAQALAGAGRRVLLFDGDLGLANVDIQLGLAPKLDLGTVLERGLPLDRAIAPAPGGFDVVAGRSGSGSLATVGGPRLRALADDLAAVAPRYDHTIVDLGAGIERTVRQLAAWCATCLVVTTDEPTALTDAYAYIKLAAADDPRRDLRIVVNMASSPAEGERTYGTLLKACKSFLKLAPPLAGIVRRDARVKDSIRAQTPTLTRYPTAAAASDVEAIARRLIAGK